MVTSVLAAALVLGLVVFVHELGHFLAAKRLGVGVLKFSLGFGPAIVSRRVGETEYCISAIPLGGFVKMVGQEDDGSDPDPETVDQENSFATKPTWAQAIIIAAGPGFNLLFAWLLYTILFATGVPVLTSQIGEVKEGMPAAVAGIEAGDKIIALDGKPIDRWEQLSSGIKSRKGASVTLTVDREGQQRTLTILPEETEGSSIFGEPIPTWVIGVGPAGKFITERSGPVEALWLGFSKTVDFVRITVVSFVKLFQQIVPVSSLGGPLMIMKIAGDQADEGLQALLAFMAILSINLGIINLFPLPILDGGHLAIMFIETIRGRPLTVRTREIATQVGLFLILSLMGFAFYNDINRMVFG